MSPSPSNSPRAHSSTYRSGTFNAPRVRLLRGVTPNPEKPATEQDIPELGPVADAAGPGWRGRDLVVLAETAKQDLDKFTVGAGERDVAAAGLAAIRGEQPDRVCERRGPACRRGRSVAA